MHSCLVHLAGLDFFLNIVKKWAAFTAFSLNPFLGEVAPAPAWSGEPALQ